MRQSITAALLRGHTVVAGEGCGFRAMTKKEKKLIEEAVGLMVLLYRPALEELGRK